MATVQEGMSFPGLPWHPQILLDQLTLSHPGGDQLSPPNNSNPQGLSNLPTALIGTHLNCIHITSHCRLSLTVRRQDYTFTHSPQPLWPGTKHMATMQLYVLGGKIQCPLTIGVHSSGSNFVRASDCCLKSYLLQLLYTCYIVSYLHSCRGTLFCLYLEQDLPRCTNKLY